LPIDSGEDEDTVMDDKLRIQDRRNSARRKLIYPALYTRFDREGRPFDEKPSRSMNVSSGGMRLQSSFPVQPKETLEIAMAMEDRLVNFKGEVVYVIRAQDQTFELGVSFVHVESRDGLALSRSKGQVRDSGPRDDQTMILERGHIVCPNCGKPIASVERIRAMTAYCKELLGRCDCGLGYEIRVSSFGSASLSFPDRQIELVC
jgi:hypothetical protein